MCACVPFTYPRSRAHSTADEREGDRGRVKERESKRGEGVESMAGAHRRSWGGRALCEASPLPDSVLLGAWETQKASRRMAAAAAAGFLLFLFPPSPLHLPHLLVGRIARFLSLLFCCTCLCVRVLLSSHLACFPLCANTAACSAITCVPAHATGLSLESCGGYDLRDRVKIAF